MNLPFQTFRLFSLLLLVALGTTASKCVSDTDGKETEVGRTAFEWGGELVALGPRPPGSAGIEKAGLWIESKGKGLGFVLAKDKFDAKTPLGQIQMKNLSYTIPGKTRKSRYVLMAHYDSKRFVGFDFVGANDSATSVSLLLALTPQIKALGLNEDVEVVFVDGEEALVRWTPSDSLYGSRRFASRLAQGKPVAAALVLDMIGDKDLRLIRSAQSDPKLMEYVKSALEGVGLSSLIDTTPVSVDDDHIPLVQAGIPTLHLMDFTYGGAESPGKYWHTQEDTMDKVSVLSLSVVGEIVLHVLKRIDGT